LLTRPTDIALVERYSRRGTTEPVFFRPIRTAVAAYEKWLHAPLTHRQVALDLSRLLEQPPMDFDNRVYVDRTLEALNAKDPTDAVRANVVRIEQLIETIERRGARVLLYELPVFESLEGSRSVKRTREIVHAKFPDPDRWLRIDCTRSELRWADGGHLDERSALIVAQSIDRALSTFLDQRDGD
jgi:hypothetical protein